MGETADPARVFTLQDFGRELSLARHKAGLTVRQVARRAGLPASTAGDYFAGRHLPPLGQPEALRRILRACGVSESERLGEWQRAVERARRGPGRLPGAGPAPYRGLASFQRADAEWFFGREDLTERLVRLAADAAAAGQPLVVVGQSGSGKSSLLRAGLIPALEAGRAGGPVVILTPGSDPLGALTAQLVSAGDSPALSPADLAARWRAAPDSAAWVPPLAVIVDQFEQVFTGGTDEAERQAFIGALCALARTVLVVLGLRADCYGHALRYADLAAALQERQLAVGPMSADQLRRVILEPARRAGLGVGDGLVELLLRDLAPRPGHGQEAAVLPLLSHALRATWERGLSGQLTVADYEASGGIADAIARTAETVYGALGEAEQRQARWLFLRLVQVSDDSIETRYRVPIAELTGGPGAGGPMAGDGVLARFVDARLITVTQDGAEIIHDALLAAWPRLRDWIDSDREGLRIRRRITEAARTWQDTGNDSAVLLRGSQLAMARDWADEPLQRDSMGALSRQFLLASSAQERVSVETERRRSRRLGQLVAALTVLVLLTIGLSGYAFAQRQAAMTAQVDADSRELAVEASQLRDQDPSVAAQLSLAAYKTARTPAAVASLLESSASPAAARLSDSADIVQAVALSPRGHLLAVAAADGTLRLWNVGRPGRPVPLGGSLVPRGAALFAVALSPDGKTLAAGGIGRDVRLWNVSDPRHPVPEARTLTGPAGSVYGLAFSPDGGVLAAASYDGTVRLWDMAGGQLAAAAQPMATQPMATLTGPGGPVQAVAFSPDGRLLAAGTVTSKAVRLWNVSQPQRPVPVGRALTGPERAVTSVAFSPDGQTLAGGSQDGRAWLWQLGSPAKPKPLAPLGAATGYVDSVAFSPDGAVLAVGGTDDSVELWNTATRRLLGTLPHPDIVTSLYWAGGHELISGCADGTVRIWTLPPPILVATSGVNSVAFSPSGGQLAAGSQDLEIWNAGTRTEEASAAVPGTFVNAVAYARPAGLLAAGYGNGGVRLWTAAGSSLAPAGPVLPSPARGMVEFVAFAAGGKFLASASDDGIVRLWNVADPGDPVLLAKVPDAPDHQVLSVAFSPDGKTLAAASTDNMTRLWNIAVPARPVSLGPPLRGTTSYDMSVAFSPDSKTLAVGSADTTVHLWDVARPARPERLGRPLVGPEGYVYSLQFSPDGKTLAAGVTDDSVWLWNTSDVSRVALIAQLTGPEGHVYSVAFSPNGRSLAAGSADGTARLWDTGEHAAARAVCATAGEPLTRSEWVSYDPGRPYTPPCQHP